MPRCPCLPRFLLGLAFSSDKPQRSQRSTSRRESSPLLPPPLPPLAAMDLSTLDLAQPHAFYLAAQPSMEALSDCHAVVNGMRLPLHSQVLSLHSAVLRELFLGQQEGGVLRQSSPTCQQPLWAAAWRMRAACCACCTLLKRSAVQALISCWRLGGCLAWLRWPTSWTLGWC